MIEWPRLTPHPQQLEICACLLCGAPGQRWPFPCPEYRGVIVETCWRARTHLDCNWAVVCTLVKAHPAHSAMPGSPTTSSGGETRPAAGAQAREQPKLTKSGALDNVAGGCASRGVFVAGFAFFELTRGGSLPAGEVAGADAATVYLVLLSAAFALGSIAAACGILVRYFQDACTTKPERTLYAESATWLATMVGTPCLVAALLAYSVALCVVGAAYFPNDDSAYLATAVVMGASAAVSVGAVLWVLVAKATARNAAPNPAAASGEVRFEPLHVCRMRQAAVFADRATFVVGFAQVRLRGGCPNSLRRTTHRGCVSGWCRPLQCSHA